MNTDWRDALAGLGASLPEGNPEPEAPKTKNEKKSVTLFFERKGRGGKPVTILADFEGISEDDIETLASDLKRSLGTGGSARGGEILIQGDRREQLRTRLKEKGFKVKG
ncbi:MAG: translation initiation factor [Muribaculaceae bacterium]|nr:translation initiation factor [Muribaculaceae bacterium]